MSHPWGATPGLTIVQGIMGIVPLKPGFDLFRLRIQPGQLKKIEVTTPSSKGIIQAKFVAEQQQNKISVNVPMNSKIRVELPKGSQLVEVNDGEEDMQPGLENSHVVLPSGNYVIAYK